MTANPPRLAGSAAGGMGWDWLTPAAEMAALVSGSWPLAPHAVRPGRACCPRIATRTPGADAGSVRAARDFTIATLRQWGVAERRDDIAVVVSELLTNALRHALPCPGGTRPRWPIRLGLLQPGPCVLCAVADPSQRAPVLQEPGHLAESGRGLHVIDALSDQWGYTTPGETGKVVWATFTAAPAPAHPGSAPRPDQPGQHEAGARLQSALVTSSAVMHADGTA